MIKHGGRLKTMHGNKSSKKVNEIVAVIWMPMLRKLLKNEHKCPCYPEKGLCPCPAFIEKLECRCGMIIVKDLYLKGSFEPVRKARVHG